MSKESPTGLPKYEPLSYVLLKELHLRPIIGQISVDGQTIMLSNRLNMSHLLVVEEIIEKSIGNRVDWWNKYPKAYAHLSKFIIEVESGTLSIQDTELNDRQSDIKSTDSLLQIRALYHLSVNHENVISNGDNLSNDLIEEAIKQALISDDLLWDQHTNLSKILKQVEDFSFHLSD
ncbi:TPA: hypothetical protein ACGIK9_002934 [Acinetobacter baumannii]|uniref:hypothetical protein n=1 Tax=Acinetobacter baumannii TaxID=470 RepID=UPI00338E3274